MSRVQTGFHIKRLVLIILQIAICTAGGLACSKEANDWKSYINKKYGYSFCYPSTVFHRRSEPDARDGALFDGPSDVMLSVSGEYSPASNMREVLDLVVKTLDGRSTYTAAGPNWRVSSGETHGNVFYSRVISGEGVIAQYVTVYPAQLNSRLTPILRQINACMKTHDASIDLYKRKPRQD